VEVPLRKDDPEKPWTGFSPEEERFFAEALRGSVTVRRRDGFIKTIELNYRQPRYLEHAGRMIPLPPVEGVPSVRGFYLLDDLEGTIKRGGEEVQGVSWRYLRDGDEIVEAASLVPRMLPRRAEFQR